MSRSAPSCIVMLGTHPATHGGVASVVSAYRDAGLFDRWPVRYIATHRDGNVLVKLITAVRALGAMVVLLLRHESAILHVHGASRVSFWRKAVFMALALAARWPIVFHLHGGGFARFYEKRCGPLGRAIVRFFLERTARI